MEPLTNLSGSRQLSGADRWAEAARVAFPAQRSERHAYLKEQEFVARFHQEQTPQCLHATRAASALRISLRSLVGVALGKLSKVIFGLAIVLSPEALIDSDSPGLWYGYDLPDAWFRRSDSDPSWRSRSKSERKWGRTTYTVALF